MQDDQCCKYQAGVVMHCNPVSMSDSKEFIHGKWIASSLITDSGRKYNKKHTSRDYGRDKEQKCTEIDYCINLSSTYHHVPISGFRDKGI